MDFDKDGKIIIPDAVKIDKEERGKSIILKRVQVNQNNPAIAQLKVTFPYDLPSPKELKVHYEILAEKFKSVENSMKQLGPKTFVFEARETWLMYTFLEKMESEIRQMFEGGPKIIKEGYWQKFDENIDYRKSY